MLIIYLSIVLISYIFYVLFFTFTKRPVTKKEEQVLFMCCLTVVIPILCLPCVFNKSHWLSDNVIKFLYGVENILIEASEKKLW